jgi:DNA-binding CsgD family transcriptional regulator
VALVVTLAADSAYRLSYELEGITDRAAFLSAAVDSVGALLPGDQFGWLAVDTAASAAEVLGVGDVSQPEILQALGRNAGRHPMMVSYGGRPRDMTPLRLSDLITGRAWRSHPVYAEVYRPLGALYQVSIMVAPLREGRWAGWGFNRTRRDFTDDDLTTAIRLQPVLITLNHVSVRAFGTGCSRPPAPPRAEAAQRVGLTPREARVLELLAAGLTATAIGHACRISPRTVSKHLENIYAKLSCHDRLVAVRRATELGLVVSP